MPQSKPPRNSQAGGAGSDTNGGASGGKVPKTERGRRTLRALLNAAALEFGEKGFHDAAISQITARAGVAAGSFYVYFDSKEAIFTALVKDMSMQVRDYVAPRIADAPDQLAAEKAGQAAYLDFVREHREIYRIIDESEFVDPASYRDHYTNSANRIAARLQAAMERGEIAQGNAEVRAWALMGINVFLGLRFGVWSDDDTSGILAEAGRFIAEGLAPRSKP
ncbi:TetR/AcrR family transcriptional regulator [Novosphingobium rosa]|uniref:TetR/AcrR family transcriptional regulator n=1 Tax=Novosphingobium rosa TaxID=76978 RepID=UPI0009FC2212|nr:TetR/AcrR family transcriptional regulator [Novosphingobium rosa]